MPIAIINRRNSAGGFYVGRPTVLGNPFKIGVDGTREGVVKMYRSWLDQKIQTKDFEVIKMLSMLIAEYKKNGQLGLACYCAPLVCHADVIAEYIVHETS
jgi:hypothetical protein